MKLALALIAALVTGGCVVHYPHGHVRHVHTLSCAHKHGHGHGHGHHKHKKHKTKVVVIKK